MKIFFPTFARANLRKGGVGEWPPPSSPSQRSVRNGKKETRWKTILKETPHPTPPPSPRKNLNTPLISSHKAFSRNIAHILHVILQNNEAKIPRFRVRVQFDYLVQGSVCFCGTVLLTKVYLKQIFFVLNFCIFALLFFMYRKGKPNIKKVVFFSGRTTKGVGRVNPSDH